MVLVLALFCNPARYWMKVFKTQLVVCRFELATVQRYGSHRATTRGDVFTLVVGSVHNSVQIGLGDFVPGTNFKGRDGEMNKIKLIINFVYLLGN
jgi:hypothetical protein